MEEGDIMIGRYCFDLGGVLIFFPHCDDARCYTSLFVCLRYLLWGGIWRRRRSDYQRDCVSTDL